MLAKAPAFEWHITPIVRGEIKSAKTRYAVERAILDGAISTVAVGSDTPEELVLLSEWRELVDPGEAEAIAVALARDWIVGIEDLAAQRLLDRRCGPGRWTNCAAILVSVVNASTLTLDDADAIFRSLDVYEGYRRRGIENLKQLMR